LESTSGLEAIGSPLISHTRDYFPAPLLLKMSKNLDIDPRPEALCYLLSVRQGFYERAAAMAFPFFRAPYVPT
jgi:hypothetical protein